ncbi:MAG: SDR family oxidoreductase [Pseudomonadota bacterium]|nr:SDR family oxidoreductase [Pseudomonadota bacterium]
MTGNRLKNKTALITGASSGMGKADAFLLSKEGAKVFLTDIDEINGQKVADEINELSANDHAAHFIKHDVSKEEDWKRVIEEISNISDSLDILVNNAGIMKTAHLDQLSLEDWRMLNSINSESQFLGCKYAMPLMEKNGNGGSIINMSSTSMIMGISNIPAYSASKGAVDALTRSIAMDCIEKKNGIRVNSIQPDSVRTPLIAKMSFGKSSVTEDDLKVLKEMYAYWIEPEDVAYTVLFLASDESRCINGTSILIDNGACIKPPAIDQG